MWDKFLFLLSMYDASIVLHIDVFQFLQAFDIRFIDTFYASAAQVVTAVAAFGWYL